MTDDRDDDVEEALDDDFTEEEFEAEEPDDFEDEPEDFDGPVDPGEEDLDPELDLDGEIDEYVVGDDVDVDEEEEDEPAPAPRARKVADDDDDEEEQDPDDVEADLEAILRDRMAAADDEDDDDIEEGGGDSLDVPPGPRGDEFVCTSCFLLVNRSQFGSAKDPRCPMGEPECPSITRIFGG